MTTWNLLITSLPTENASARMRAWRNLKSSGAAVLRDGVYLMPLLEQCLHAFEEVATDIRSSGGTAVIAKIEEPSDENFISLFDRTSDYSSLSDEIISLKNELSKNSANDILKKARKLRKLYSNISSTDFFPSDAQKQIDDSLTSLEQQIRKILSPNEPIAISNSIEKLIIGDYKNRLWATRNRPWVDRLACAWLIKRYIDTEAKIIWLSNLSDCPKDALGFDFDGATFTHIGSKVTFEVLLSTFNLETPALQRLGTLVHFLDVGGVQPAEAIGVESALAGIRKVILDDDQLLLTTNQIFDGLLDTFEKDVKK